MHQEASQILKDVNQQQFDTGTQNWEDDELVLAVRSVCAAAMHNSKAGYKMQSDEEQTRLDMRRIALDELSGQWANIDTSADGSGSSWQITLKNGSAIRVCELD